MQYWLWCHHLFNIMEGHFNVFNDLSNLIQLKIISLNWTESHRIIEITSIQSTVINGKPSSMKKKLRNPSRIHSCILLSFLPGYSISNNIWMITSFYSFLLALAQANGAAPIPEIHDVDWPDEPDSNDSWDTSLLSEWLAYFLAVDNIHEFRMRGISSRQADRQRCRRATWTPAAQRYRRVLPAMGLGWLSNWA